VRSQRDGIRKQILDSSRVNVIDLSPRCRELAGSRSSLNVHTLDGTLVKQLKLGTRVQFTEERIRQLDTLSAKRYRQRVGTVVGYRQGAKGPLVEFDADEERRSEILQDVALAYLNVLAD
jgi:hypothetical protein